MNSISPAKARQLSDYAKAIGGGGVFYGIIFGVVYLAMLVIGVGSIDEEGYGIFIFALVHVVAFFGLVMVGFLLIYKSQYVLLLLVPFTVIGLTAFPFGTVFYYCLWRGIWEGLPLYYPFNRKQRRSDKGKGDDD